MEFCFFTLEDSTSELWKATPSEILFDLGTEGWRGVGGYQQEKARWHPEEVGVVREEGTNWDGGGVMFG